MLQDMRQDMNGHAGQLGMRCGVGKNAHFGAVAQWLERTTHNRLVAGSIPACPTESHR